MKLSAATLRRAEKEYGLFLLEYVEKNPGSVIGPATVKEFYLRGYADSAENRSLSAIEAECEVALELASGTLQSGQIAPIDEVFEDMRAKGLIRGLAMSPICREKT